MDIEDVEIWQKKIQEFHSFAKRVEAEFKLERFENGKESLLIRLFYKPRKGEINAKS